MALALAAATLLCGCPARSVLGPYEAGSDVVDASNNDGGADTSSSGP